jgi:AcrR family transcriptional regulator
MLVPMATTTRERIVDASSELFRRQGFTGTGVKQIVAAASAPFGSLYHHFPGGKSELLHAALDMASERGLAALEGVRGEAAGGRDRAVPGPLAVPAGSFEADRRLRGAGGHSVWR